MIDKVAIVLIVVLCLLLLFLGILIFVLVKNNSKQFGGETSIIRVKSDLSDVDAGNQDGYQKYADLYGVFVDNTDPNFAYRIPKSWFSKVNIPIEDIKNLGGIRGENYINFDFKTLKYSPQLTNKEIIKIKDKLYFFIVNCFHIFDLHIKNKMPDITELFDKINTSRIYFDESVSAKIMKPEEYEKKVQLLNYLRNKITLNFKDVLNNVFSSSNTLTNLVYNYSDPYYDNTRTFNFVTQDDPALKRKINYSVINPKTKEQENVSLDRKKTNVIRPRQGTTNDEFMGIVKIVDKIISIIHFRITNTNKTSVFKMSYDTENTTFLRSMCNSAVRSWKYHTAIRGSRGNGTIDTRTDFVKQEYSDQKIKVALPIDISFKDEPNASDLIPASYVSTHINYILHTCFREYINDKKPVTKDVIIQIFTHISSFVALTATINLFNTLQQARTANTDYSDKLFLMSVSPDIMYNLDQQYKKELWKYESLEKMIDGINKHITPVLHYRQINEISDIKISKYDIDISRYIEIFINSEKTLYMLSDYLELIRFVLHTRPPNFKASHLDVNDVLSLFIVRDKHPQLFSAVFSMILNIYKSYKELVSHITELLVKYKESLSSLSSKLSDYRNRYSPYTDITKVFISTISLVIYYIYHALFEFTNTIKQKINDPYYSSKKLYLMTAPKELYRKNTIEMHDYIVNEIQNKILKPFSSNILELCKFFVPNQNPLTLLNDLVELLSSCDGKTIYTFTNLIQPLGILKQQIEELNIDNIQCDIPIISNDLDVISNSRFESDDNQNKIIQYCFKYLLLKTTVNDSGDLIAKINIAIIYKNVWENVFSKIINAAKGKNKECIEIDDKDKTYYTIKYTTDNPSISQTGGSGPVVQRPGNTKPLNIVVQRPGNTKSLNIVRKPAQDAIEPPKKDDVIVKNPATEPPKNTTAFEIKAPKIISEIDVSKTDTLKTLNIFMHKIIEILA